MKNRFNVSNVDLLERQKFGESIESLARACNVRIDTMSKYLHILKFGQKKKIIGKELFSYLLDKYTEPPNLSYNQINWGRKLRNNFKEEFEKSYLHYIKTNEVKVFNIILKLK